MYKKEFTTHQAVILQSRAHRAIKTHLSQLLKVHGLTMMQWSIIGLIADADGEGVRISDLARQLDTSLAFITTSVNVLEAKSFVSRAGHAHDNRAKLVRLNPEFAPKVAIIESDLKTKQQATLYKGLAPKDLEVYTRVLRHFANA